MVVRNWEWILGYACSAVVVVVIINAEGISTYFLTIRKVEVNATADSELSIV